MPPKRYVMKLFKDQKWFTLSKDPLNNRHLFSYPAVVYSSVYTLQIKRMPTYEGYLRGPSGVHYKEAPVLVFMFTLHLLFCME